MYYTFLWFAVYNRYRVYFKWDQVDKEFSESQQLVCVERTYNGMSYQRPAARARCKDR